MSKDKKIKDAEFEEKKVDSKKLQDRLILITRIVGVSFFLVGLAIIFITAIIRSKNVIEEEIEYESFISSVPMNFDDSKLLEKEYLVLNNEEDYNNFFDQIDEWYNDALSNYTKITNENENIDEARKLELINEYKDFNDSRYHSLKRDIGIKISEEVFDTKSVIVVEDVTSGMVLQNSSLNDICLNEGKLTIHINKDVVGVVSDVESSLYFIEIDKKYVKNDIVVSVSTDNNSDPNVDYKPVIYIYPEEEIDVNVRVGYKDLLIVDYPEYNDGWNVHALVDGTLIDKNTHRELYALYYESVNKIDFKVEEDGFVVKGSDSARFLEEKLEILGLNSKEINEFIIYWLPKLESNNYNYIRFATNEEINFNMPLIIEPKPDNVIRILMTFKGLDKEIEVLEQQLTKVNRSGYSVVEWGGTIIN